MTDKRALIEAAKASPLSVYRQPHDVLRDRRLNAEQRVEVLRSWAMLAGIETRDQVAAALQEAEMKFVSEGT